MKKKRRMERRVSERAEVLRELDKEKEKKKKAMPFPKRTSLYGYERLYSKASGPFSLGVLTHKTHWLIINDSWVLAWNLFSDYELSF